MTPENKNKKSHVSIFSNKQDRLKHLTSKCLSRNYSPGRTCVQKKEGPVDLDGLSPTQEKQ
jgi:hypothetical protein